MGVALSFHLTWIEWAPSPSASPSSDGETGTLESQGPWKEMSSESRYYPTYPVPGEGLNGYLGTFLLSLSWREVRPVCSFCLCHLLQSHSWGQPVGCRAREGEEDGICVQCLHLLPWLRCSWPLGAPPQCTQISLCLCCFILH